MSNLQAKHSKVGLFFVDAIIFHQQPIVHCCNALYSKNIVMLHNKHWSGALLTLSFNIWPFTVYIYIYIYIGATYIRI